MNVPRVKYFCSRDQLQSICHITIALLLLLLAVSGVQATECTVCQSGCDYITNGTDDQTEINNAIANTSCDVVSLTDATYNVSKSGTYKFWDAKNKAYAEDAFSIVIDNRDDLVLKGLGKRQTVIEVDDPCTGTDGVIFINGTYVNNYPNELRLLRS